MFRFALGGDIILSRQVVGMSSIARLSEVVKGCDVVFGNMETPIIQRKTAPSGTQSGGWLYAPRGVARDLHTIGINVVSLANNHSLDWGVEGARSTQEALESHGIVHAGFGENLSEASTPRFYDAGPVRVGLVAATTTFSDEQRAGAQRGDTPGRPGINAIGHSVRCKVKTSDYEVLKNLGETLQIGHSLGFNRVIYAGMEYESSDEYGIETIVDSKDEKRILDAVKLSSLHADFTILSVHTHEISFSDWESPPEFLVSLCRRAVERGATMVVCHGTHVLRGVEIHLGRPIFYGLGNLFFNDLAFVQPTERYHEFNLDDSAGPLTLAKAIHEAKEFEEDIFWEGLMATVNIDHKSSFIELFALDLCGDHPARHGLPALAQGDKRARILERIARLSETLGVPPMGIPSAGPAVISIS